MYTSLNKRELCDYVIKQLETYMPDRYVVDKTILEESINIALLKCENCFKHILLPGYRDGDEAVFSHLHMDQYASFIYFLGNTIWEKYHEKTLCDKLLNLNRIVNGFFLSYKCEMPDIFILAHPVGSVIGNAKYSNGLYISQNVTINTHVDGNGDIDLEIGEYCFLGAGAKIIGGKKIGNRVSIGVDAMVYNKEIEDDVVVKNMNGKMTFQKREKQLSFAETVFTPF